MKKLIALVLALIMLLSLCACGGKSPEDSDKGSTKTENSGNKTDKTDSKGEKNVNDVTPLLSARHPESKDDILSVISYRGGYSAGYGGMVMEEAEIMTAPTVNSGMKDEAFTDGSASEIGGAGGYGAPDYSGTNVQVNGIDEADVVKTDGEFIYVLNDNELAIFKADGEYTVQLSNIIIGRSHYSDNGKKYGEGYSYSSVYKEPAELFLCGDNAVIISRYSGVEETEVNGKYNYKNESVTIIDYVDISRKTAPSVKETVKQDGIYKSSRLLDGRIYVITGYNVWDCDEDDVNTYMPHIYKSGEYCVMPLEDIYILPDRSCQSYTVVSSYGTAAPGEVNSTAYLGRSDDIYMSLNNLYISASEWRMTETELPHESVYKVTEISEDYETYICRFALDTLEMTGDATVPGRLDDRFSMDEYEGRLRIVTTSQGTKYKRYDDEEYGFCNYDWSSSSSESYSGLYILSEGMQLLGKVDRLGEDETVYSARFDGNIAYFCTFRQIDPLFAVDCSDPTSPKVLSALKISGFSDYLHSWNENRLFGAGFEADEKTGRRGCLKLVMFDVSDRANVTAENTYLIDGCYYSSAMYDVKGFLVDGEKNIISFAGDGDYYVFSYDEEGGFKSLAHVELGDYYWQSRSLYIGDYLYIVGDNNIFVLSMDSWELVSSPVIAKG